MDLIRGSLKAYKEAQNSDFVIIGSHAGINDWNKSIVLNELKNTTQKLSVTIQDWMMEYTMLGLTKLASEQGDWAGQVALAILDGSKPNSIPIISNRKWDIWLNESLLDLIETTLPARLYNKANKVQTD